VARAVASRRREFAKGRECARAALARFGIRDFALLAGSEREPLWPPNVVGSISHVDCLCAVAVGLAEHYAGVGLDIEHARPLEPAIAERVVFDADVVNAEFSEHGLSSTLIFSAKEAFYKCQFPSSRTFLDFFDVAITLEGDGRFSARLCVDAGPLARGTSFQGRWRSHSGLFFTAICRTRELRQSELIVQPSR